MTELGKETAALPVIEGYAEELAKRKREKGRRRNRRIMVSAALLALLVIFLLLLLRGCQPGGDGALERETAAQAGIMPGLTQEEIEERLNQVVEDSKVAIRISPTPVVKDGKITLRLENVQGNHYSCTVKIVLDQDGSTVLETGLVEPGYYIEAMDFDAEVEPGVYDAVANYTFYDLETGSTVGGSNLKIVLLVSE